MWFNHLVAYQLNSPFQLSIDDLNPVLDGYRLKPCPPHARFSQGFIPPFEQSEDLVYGINACHIITAAKEVRLLPNGVIQSAVKEQEKAFALQNHRAMRRSERLQLKEDIEFDLLPKAFSLKKTDWLYIDTLKQWLIVHASSINKASDLLGFLTKATGSLDATLLTPGDDIRLSTLFAKWLKHPASLPNALILGKKCILMTEEDDNSHYTCKDIAQNTREITTLLDEGYFVSSLELIWEERIQFTLTNEFILKRIVNTDYQHDALKDIERSEDEQEQFASHFTLMTGEFRQLIGFLLTLEHET